MPGFEDAVVKRREHVRATAGGDVDVPTPPGPIAVDGPSVARIDALLADLRVLVANVARQADGRAFAPDMDTRLTELRQLLGLTVGDGELPAPVDLGEFAVHTVQFVYIESAPGRWHVGGPESLDWFEFDPWLVKHLPEPFRAALQALCEAEMDGAMCWQCAREVVGWAEVCREGPRGEEIYGMEWTAVGLLVEPGSNDPVNLVCEACTPYVLDTPAPRPPRVTGPTKLEVKGD